MKKFRLLSKILCNILAVLVGLLGVGSAIANENASAINSFLGASTQKIIQGDGAEAVDYYTTKYKSVDELRAASEEINERVMEEGMVLLKNENNALPLAKGSEVSLYSANSVTFVYAGSGSSSNLPQNVNKNAVNLKDGLTAAGLVVDETLWNWYYSHTEYWQGQVERDADGNAISTVSGNRQQTARFYTKDAPWDELPSAAKNGCETAIFIISRNGGENADFYSNTKFDTMSSGNYLELGDNEKDVLANLKLLKDAGKVGKIVVIMNSANQVQCDFADDPTYGVDALLWVGMVGSTGTKAIGRVLTGEVNPSGRLSDTFWYKHSANPVYANFGTTEYYNASTLDNFKDNKYYVVYQEGIYNGYRYTETRYEDFVTGASGVGSYDYATMVSYPFGYGLSYTKFVQNLDNVERYVDVDNNVQYNVTVTVTNNGEKSGKDVVQVYLQKPYTEYDRTNGLQKASVELVGYAKTDELAPGQSQTLTVSVEERYFATYDYVAAKTYVIGSTDKADNYYLTVASDAHSAINNILAKKGYAPQNNEKIDAAGVAEAVYETHIGFDSTKYSINKNIKTANTNFTAKYDGQEANFGVQSITNQFSDVDYQLYEGFSAEEQVQPYVTRSDWQGTVGQTIVLTASAKLRADQATIVPEPDSVEYPSYGKQNGLTLAGVRSFENGALIEYDNPLWDDLLDQLTWDETVAFLSDGLRQTGAIESINAPKTLQFNGAVGPVPGDAANNSKYNFNSTDAPFQGFVVGTGGENEYPNFFCCNGIVASTFNDVLQQELGEQIGEECLWVGMAGLYGMGVNLHRVAYCGRNFEYYSEDGYLAGMACGYEIKGVQSKGVFVIMKHALLNDQEDGRHGICSWANEQTIRELYLMPIEISVKVGDTAEMAGMMTGLNRMGAKWCSVQGFCNTVLRAELGMKGFIISDFYTKYMNPVSGVMFGNDLPDGTVTKDSKTYDDVTRNFDEYSVGYGKLAWQMREAAHRVLYTVVRSSAMNRITSDTKIIKITPTWQKVLTASCVTVDVLFALSVVFVAFTHLYKRKSATAA